MLKVRLPKSATSGELYQQAVTAFGTPVTIGNCAVWQDVEVMRERAGLFGNEPVVLWTAKTLAGQEWLNDRAPEGALIVSSVGPGLATRLSYKTGSTA